MGTSMELNIFADTCATRMGLHRNLDHNMCWVRPLQPTVALPLLLPCPRRLPLSRRLLLSLRLLLFLRLQICLLHHSTRLRHASPPMEIARMAMHVATLMVASSKTSTTASASLPPREGYWDCSFVT